MQVVLCNAVFMGARGRVGSSEGARSRLTFLSFCPGADDEEDDDSVAEVDAMMDFGSGPISGPLA